MLTQIVVQILRGTPPWVFALFLGLIVLGYLQSKPRDVAPMMIAILPVALGALSLSRVLAVFGLDPLALAAWATGTAAALLLNRALKQPAEARWSAETGTFHVPGSWVPLVLMMAVFFARYALAVSLVMRPALVHSAGFATGASFAYGLLSGVFLARALWVWSQRPAQPLINRLFKRA
jgi:peptidoglycan biosynthesis protein MviN/MurJ (putative lipid II flippase)